MTTTYSVRCRSGSCRHRRRTSRHPDDDKRPCPSCGTTSGWRIEERAYNRRGLCNCSGPEASQEEGKSYPHRSSHPLCDQNPRGPYNQARARGVTDDDIPLEHLGAPMAADADCPF